MSDYMNIALIGCGRISSVHLESIKTLEKEGKAKLVAVCDIVEERAKTKGEKYGVTYYKDYHEMLKNEKIDLISITTPNGTHYKIAKECALANKHVLLEKPITINLNDSDDLINIFKGHNLYFFAVLQVRYNNTLQFLKKMITEEKLGKLLSASVVVRWTRPQEYFNDWRGTKNMDGGTVINQGIHYIDALQWLMGPVESVYALNDTVAHNIEIEDEAMALIKFKNGVISSYEFTINAYPKNMECSITILGTKGTVKIGGTAMNKIEYWKVKNVSQPELEEIKPNIYAAGLYQGSCPNHIFIYNDIIRILTRGGTNYISGEEARKSLEIVKAIYNSSEMGKPVKFLE